MHIYISRNLTWRSDLEIVHTTVSKCTVKTNFSIRSAEMTYRAILPRRQTHCWSLSCPTYRKLVKDSGSNTGPRISSQVGKHDGDSFHDSTHTPLLLSTSEKKNCCTYHMVVGPTDLHIPDMRRLSNSDIPVLHNHQQCNILLKGGGGAESDTVVKQTSSHRSSAITCLQ